MSQVICVRPAWACGAIHGEPLRLIAKLPSASAGMRELAARNGLYRNEALWYQELAPSAGIPVPKVYASAGSGPPEDFFILMEDMWPSTPGGARPAFDLVERGVDVLAGFHAKWWQKDAVLRHPWLPGVDLARDERWVVENEADLSAAANENRMRYGDVYHDYVFQSAQATAKAFRQIRERTQSRPRTLLHGDFTTRQFFVPSSEGGRFAVGDWQTVTVGVGAEDLGRHLSIQLDTETRRTNERRLAERYHGGLLARGVRDYSLSDLWEDFRWSLWRTIWVQTRAFAAVSDAQIARLRARAAAANEPNPQATNVARLAACLQDHEYLSLFASTAS